jgi:vancomycin resistance protein VanJ
MKTERVEGRRGRGRQSQRRPHSRARWLSPLGPLLLVFLIWAGERAIGERWWLTTWVLYLPQMLYLAPSLLMMALALLLRRWRALAGQVAVVVLGVGLLFGGAYRLPHPMSRGDLRVMTWNIESLGESPPGVLAAIRREAPDVLLLQEITRDRGPDPLPWLEARLPGWASVHAGDVAIFSPHRLGRARRHPMELGLSTRVVLQVPMRLHGRTVQVITVHFSTALPRPLREHVWNHPRHSMQIAAAVRARQSEKLLAVIERTAEPTVVGGDFNSPPGSVAFEWVADRLQSAFDTAGTGFGWTFPARFPLLRIDHLFVSRDLRVLNCRVLPLRASDHRPVVADLAWR